jgi:hypothetical protein
LGRSVKGAIPLARPLFLKSRRRHLTLTSGLFTLAIRAAVDRVQPDAGRPTRAPKSESGGPIALDKTQGNIIMRFQLASAMIITLCLAACNGAKSPDTVAKDVATAEQKASTEVAKSEDSAAKDLNSAAGKVDDKVVAFNNAAAKDVYNLAIAKADGIRQVALANCESANGNAQKLCKEQAEADYAAAKANAKAVAQAEKQ